MSELLDHLAPEGETKEDRARRLARLRKRKQRRNEDLARIRAEAVKLNLEFYASTVAALNQVVLAGGFTGAQAADEAITLLLHGAAQLSVSDPEAFERLITPPRREVSHG